MKLAISLMVLVLISPGATLVGTRPQNTDSIHPRGVSVDDHTLLALFLRSGTPELTSYAARRRLMASARDGRMQAQLEAWTYLDPDGTFRFEIVCAQGSGLIRRHVLLGALEAEQRSWQRQEAGQAALTPDNYDFALERPAAEGMREIRLRPRRKSQVLIEGSVLVRETSADLVRVEGRLSKTPSWWTRRVDIVRRYARIGGVRVPVEMTSTADVRFAGTASFAMTYDYARINGEALAEDVSPDCDSKDQLIPPADVAARLR